MIKFDGKVPASTVGFCPMAIDSELAYYDGCKEMHIS